MAPPIVTVHLAALGIYVATCLYTLLVLVPSAALAKDGRVQRRRLAAAFRILNPAAIGALGVLLVTGAVRLTDIKASLGSAFFAQVGRPLAFKLALAFFVINVATYVAFGCGLRVVRAHQGDLPIDANWQRRMLVRVGIATCIALGLTLAAIRVSLDIGSVLRGTAPAPHASSREGASRAPIESVAGTSTLRAVRRSRSHRGERPESLSLGWKGDAPNVCGHQATVGPRQVVTQRVSAAPERVPREVKMTHYPSPPPRHVARPPRRWYADAYRLRRRALGSHTSRGSNRAWASRQRSFALV